MTVFKSYFKILKRNSTTLMIHLIVFIIMLVGTLLSIPDSDYQIEENYRVSIINRDTENEIVNNLISFLERKYVIKPIEDDYEVTVNNLVNDYSDYVLVIDKDLELKYYGNSQNASSILINMTINQYLNNYDIAKKYLENPGEAMSEIMLVKTDVSYATKESVDEQSKMVNNFYRLIAYPLMALVMNSVYLGLKNYNKSNIKNRIKVSGVEKKRYTIQLFLAALTSVVGLWFLINIIPVLLFDVEKTKLLLYALNSFVFILPMTAIAYLLSDNINKEAAVNSAITLISLGLSFTSGIFVTEELLNPNVIRISSLFPAYWYVQANKAIANTNVDGSLIKYFGVMITITMGVIGLNVILKRRKFS